MKTQIKKYLLKGALLALAAALLPAAGVFAEDEAWGPQDRQTYTWENPADEVTFNSITDNPGIGDERNFVRVKEYGTTGPHVDVTTVEPGKEYEVYIYYHNNAKASLNDSGIGIADNVRISSSIPTILYPGQSGMVKGVIGYSKIVPSTRDEVWETVWDTAYLQANDTIYFQYVDSSAVLHNGGSANGTILIAEALFSSDGAQIAHWNDYETDWGMIPGCNEYAGYVTYRVKAVKATAELEKTITTSGGTAESISAKAEDEVEFQAQFNNSSSIAYSNVTFKDAIPEGMTAVSGSAVITKADGSTVNVPDELFSDGYNFGTLHANEGLTLTYKAKVKKADELNCGTATVKNNLTVTYQVAASPRDDVYTLTDTAEVKITKTDGCDSVPEPEPEPEPEPTPDPEPTPTPEPEQLENPSTPSMPTELPSTGPAEIVFAILIIAGIGAGIFYFWQSKKTLDEATAGAGKPGRKGKGTKSEKTADKPSDKNKKDKGSEGKDNSGNSTTGGAPDAGGSSDGGSASGPESGASEDGPLASIVKNTAAPMTDALSELAAENNASSLAPADLVVDGIRNF